MFRESGLFARTVARQAPEDPEEKQIVGKMEIARPINRHVGFSHSMLLGAGR